MVDGNIFRAFIVQPPTDEASADECVSGNHLWAWAQTTSGDEVALCFRCKRAKP
jgi:hypothetical protein